jgi:hypothetical protein
VSYRRADSGVFALRIADRLAVEFGRKHVFMDVEALEGGDDFPNRLAKNLDTADACLVVIGPQWSSIVGPDGQRRLDSPTDYVRREVRLALDRGIKVIPLLVGGAQMPAEADFPPDLSSLARLHAVTLTSSNFVDDMEGLFTPLRAGGAIHVILPAFAGPFIGSSLNQLLREATIRPIRPAAEFRNVEAVMLLGTMIYWAAAMFGVGLAARRAFGLKTREVARTAILMSVSAGITQLLVLGARTLEVFGLLEDFFRLFELEDAFNRFRLEAIFRAFIFWGLAASSILLGTRQVGRLGFRLAAFLALAVGLGASVGVLAGMTLDRFGRELVSDLDFRDLDFDLRFLMSFEFAIRWVLMGLAVMWCLHRRFPLNGRRQVVAAAGVLAFGYLATVASSAVATALGRNAWGLPNGVLYGIFVPLVLRYVIPLLQDSAPAKVPHVVAASSSFSSGDSS